MNRDRRKGEPPTPPKLVPAIQYLTQKFHDEDRLYGQLSSFFCRSELHPIPIDEVFAYSLKNFENLKQTISAEILEGFSETIAQKTAPAIVKGYFEFYVWCAIPHALDWYKECLAVARANPEDLNMEPETWAWLQVRDMIRNSRFYAESWLQSVCENRTYRPATVYNEVLLNKSWRPPLFLAMLPFGLLPFKDKAVLERGTEQMGKIFQTYVANTYEQNILKHVERLASNEEFNALKNGPGSSVASSPDESRRLPRTNVSRRQIRKGQTQEIHRGWQIEYKKLVKRYKGESDVTYSKKIAGSPAGKGRSAETIRKHMKKVGRNNFAQLFS